MNYKRQLNQQVYDQIGLMILSYEEIVEKLIRKSIHTSYDEEVDSYDILLIESQIENGKRYVDQLREIQFWSMITILSDGGLINETELTTILTIINDLLNIASDELKNKQLADWASDKIIVLDQIRDVLLQIFQHKVQIKTKRGDLTLQ